MSAEQFVVPDGTAWEGHSKVFEVFERDVPREDRHGKQFIDHLVFSIESKIIGKFYQSAADSALFAAAADPDTGLVASHATIRDLQAQLAEQGERLRRTERKATMLREFTDLWADTRPYATRKKHEQIDQECRFCGNGSETGEPVRTGAEHHEHASCAERADA